MMRVLGLAGLGVMLAGGPVLAEGSYPSPASPWAAGQYVDFYFAHSNGNQALPHLRSAEGRALFARLTDRGNVERIVTAPLPLAEKRRQLGMIVMAVGEARGAYGLALKVGEPLSEELARLQAFNLFAIARAAALGGNRPPVAAWKTSLLGAAQALGEGQVYSAAQRALLAEAIAAEMTVLGPLLEAEERRRLADFAGRLGGSSDDAGLRQALGRLVVAVEGVL